ncbi:MAG: FAD-dependent oxidoreductase, partial [Deltaproteobacteria bacterium]|nr:FAD-dependent oxidoreductase [Deltaproteobacteria bacterium]
IERLAEKLPPGSIRLNHPVCALEQDANTVRVQIGVLEEEPRACFLARQVILALPPRLAAASLLFTPELSPQLTQAMLKTGTWMAGQAKFCALYENPFWRNAGFSGQAFSQLGPMAELHDASAPAGPPYGLIGFVGLPAVQRHDSEALQEAIKSQLALFYGADAARPLRVYYQDWAREPFTATSLDQPPMYEHPLYRPPAGQSSFWNNLVHFAGTETAARHGGYLEGALEAAARAVADLKPGT